MKSIIFLALAVGIAVAKPLANEGQLSFNDGHFLVDYTLSSDKSSITFKATVTNVTGWIGIGVSHVNEGMKEADIVVGEVASESTLAAGDYNSNETGRPHLDAAQNIDNVKTSRDANSKSATLEFTRKLNTGDAEGDVVIPLDGIYVLWSVSDVPTLDDGGHVASGYSEEKVIFG